MKYKVIYPDDLESIEFESYESAMAHIDSFPMETELSLKVTGYSPVTLEEAQFYCEDYTQEAYLLEQVHKGITPEQALVKMGFEDFLYK